MPQAQGLWLFPPLCLPYPRAAPEPPRAVPPLWAVTRLHFSLPGPLLPVTKPWPCSHRSPPVHPCCAHPSPERQRRPGGEPRGGQQRARAWCHAMWTRQKASGQTPEGPGVEDARRRWLWTRRRCQCLAWRGTWTGHTCSPAGGGARAGPGPLLPELLTELLEDGAGRGWTGQRCPSAVLFPSCSVSGLCLRLHNKVV